jgi:hypothetical protein
MNTSNRVLRLALATTIGILMFLGIVSVASAQSAIAGDVKDTSGASLPGVTVEASSPALIEKLRTAVTGERGAYRLVDLRPGVYTVVFTLPGFSTVRREGLELPAAFTATLNAEMAIGGVEETITVTGSSPIVDAQGTTSQFQLQTKLLDGLPTNRNPQGFAPILPAVVGKFNSVAVESRLYSAHGNLSSENNIAIDGVSQRWGNSGGASQVMYPSEAIVRELIVETDGQSAERQMSGVWIDIVPKEGGNQFRGGSFVNYANEHLETSNLTSALNAQGLTQTNGLKAEWDFTADLGGPVLSDKLWFHAAVRSAGSERYIAGLSYNATPLGWVYTPDLTRPASAKATDQSYDGRITWQVTPRNKFSAYFAHQPHIVHQRGTQVGGGVQTNFNALNSLESTTYADTQNEFAQFVWKSPVTSRLLLEAGVTSYYMDWQNFPERNLNPSADTVAATGLSTQMTLRASGSHPRLKNKPVTSRFVTSYVTGSHAFKMGADWRWSTTYSDTPVNRDMTVSLLNGRPRSLTIYANPRTT